MCAFLDIVLPDEPNPRRTFFWLETFQDNKAVDEITRHMVMVLALFERNLLPPGEMNVKSSLVESVSLFTLLSRLQQGGLDLKHYQTLND